MRESRHTGGGQGDGPLVTLRVLAGPWAVTRAPAGGDADGRRRCVRRATWEHSVLPAHLGTKPTIPSKKRGSLKGKKDDRGNPAAEPRCGTVRTVRTVRTERTVRLRAAPASALSPVALPSRASCPSHRCVLICVSLMKNGVGSLLLCLLLAVPLW